jgi:signal peptidase I
MSEKKQKSKVREYAETLIIALLIALFVRAFVVQAFKIPSSSMEPTLLVGDHLLVNKFIYGIRIPLLDKKILRFSEPQRGDVIVFVPPHERNKDFIKRVIGLPGDTVEIKDRKIYINDTLIEDPWGVFNEWNLSTRDNYGPNVVPPDSLFVMGDNRNNSQDSRYWGFASLNDVLGQAFIMYWSWDWDKPSIFDKVRWKRIGHLIR